VVAVVATDHTVAEPAVLDWVVRAVRNLPASVAVCVYVEDVAPGISEH
jgi:hypothetical protein